MADQVTAIVNETTENILVEVSSDLMATLPWVSVTDKPAVFPPSEHTHTSSDISDFDAAVVSASPSTTDASLLTEGTLPDERLSSAVSASLAKADTASQLGHTHTSTDIADFEEAVVEAAPKGTTSEQISVVATTQGSYQPGSVISAGTPFETILKNMLTTAIPATYQQPSLSISLSNPSQGSYVELGSTISPTASVNWQQGDAGAAISFALQRNVPADQIFSTVVSLATPPTSASVPSFVVTQQTTRIRSVVGYAQGPQKQDNLGNDSGTPIPAGSITSAEATYNGVYPWYYIKSPVAFTAAQFAAAITAGDASGIHANATLTKTVAGASGTLSVPYNVSGQYIGVAYESNSTTKTVYYVTALDNGPIAAVFQPVAIVKNVATAFWTRNYKLHISANPLTNSNPTLELRDS